MIILAVFIVRLQASGSIAKLKIFEWCLIISGAFVTFITFILDYSKILLKEGLLLVFAKLADWEHVHMVLSQFKPSNYNWYLFLLGEALITCAIIIMLIRVQSEGWPFPHCASQSERIK